MEVGVSPQAPVQAVPSQRPREGNRPRVCFYSEFAYPLLADGGIPFAGGAETMVVLLARHLARRGYDVSLVTCDYGQPERVVIDGIEVLRAFRPGKGIRGLRFFHPRLSLATRALMRAKADVYYVCGSGMPAGLTCDVAKLRGAGFVLGMMTDRDVVASPPPNTGVTHRRWFLRALRRADCVLAQTEFQRDQLERNFEVKSTILPNMVEIPGESVDPGRNELIFWHATYNFKKRPEWFLRLARDLPQYRFIMAGMVPPAPHRRYWDEAVAASRTLSNLEVRGFLPKQDLDSVRRRTALLVHTSPVEGFSNVLLEAWALGLPTVSGVNPDGLVTRVGVGAYAPDYESLLESVRRLMSDPEARGAAGARARRYAETHHAPDVVLDVLTRALEDARPRRSR
jgi:glycosyltransferase involved in cell wall biosynthesis